MSLSYSTCNEHQVPNAGKRQSRCDTSRFVGDFSEPYIVIFAVFKKKLFHLIINSMFSLNMLDVFRN